MVKRAPVNVRYLWLFGEHILTRSFTARDPFRTSVEGGDALRLVVMVAPPARSGRRLGSTSSGNGAPSPMQPCQDWTSSGIGISPSHPSRCVRIGRPQSSLAAWRKVVAANRPSHAIPILQHDPVQSLSARRLTNQQ